MRKPHSAGPNSGRCPTIFRRYGKSYAYPAHVTSWRATHLKSVAESRALREGISSIRQRNRRNHRGSYISQPRGARRPFPLSYFAEAQLDGAPPLLNIGSSMNFPSTIDTDCDSPDSSDDSFDIPSTPGSVCDQFRSGPFGHLFDGLRITDQERDLLEELVQPPAMAHSSAEIVETLSQMTYFDFMRQNSSPTAGSRIQKYHDQSSTETEAKRDNDGSERPEDERGKPPPTELCQKFHASSPKSGFSTVLGPENDGGATHIKADADTTEASMSLTK